MFFQKCEIIPTQYTEQFGESDNGRTETYKCRCESEEGFTPGINGRVPSEPRLYLLPYDAIVYAGDKIRLVDNYGTAVSEGHQIVRSAFPVGGRFIHHYEVRTDRGTD